MPAGLRWSGVTAIAIAGIAEWLAPGWCRRLEVAVDVGARAEDRHRRLVEKDCPASVLKVRALVRVWRAVDVVGKLDLAVPVVGGVIGRVPSRTAVARGAGGG